MNKEELKLKIFNLTQFPHKQRKMNYQSYYIDGEEVGGSRNTKERMEIMKIPESLSDMSVLDLGCNLGSVCFECWERGSRKLMGLDNETDYIECARDLTIYNKCDIDFQVKDLTNIRDTSEYVKKYFEGKDIDIVFALSLYKHIKVKMFHLLDSINWKKCIIESNNAPEGLSTGHVREMISHIDLRRWKWTHIGTDSTRSPRIILEVFWTKPGG